MRKRIRTIELTFETERRVEARTRPRGFRGFCAGCAAETIMVTPDEAAAIAQVSTRTIYRWVEGGKVHFIETPEGSLLICMGHLCQRCQT